MKPRMMTALALVAALASTGVIVVRADAQQGAGPQADMRAPPRMPRPSPTDRAAFLDAHIAAVHAGLQLTPDQDKLWPAVESAVRDGAAKMAALRDQAEKQPRPSDPVDAMRRMADAASTRGDALHKIVDAAQPLYASLTDDQKHRLPMLLHGPRRMGGMGMDRQRFMGHGDIRRQDGPRGPQFGGDGPNRPNGNHPDRDDRGPPMGSGAQERL